ncbi:efflux RND transporter periplasmic adaptor subunit [Lentiprolixibacter aurantiacus]|uniref:Efflux RND transporter periplasmic adaptor subunit n=1 Tax=Lentiprolixibacter aurantiacus TaxID=2993939 RepID=A0AAE3MME7_9FLAO|nr:efflux RND transporter periplasmic adaptor subunit [Lentiprolixibacter aurantiacus]MCX2720123.1 efflux RND transporter periplasmic adaptor subunit [Lentiprolixibacter aurantiacus]
MKRVNRIVILFFSIGILFSCKGREEGIAREGDALQADSSTEGIRISEEQFNSRNMSVGKLESITVSDVVTTQGYVDVPPEGRAIVSAPMPGFVRNAPYIVGEYVKRGQHLLTLENPEFVILQQSYLEALAQNAYLKSEYERVKTLFEEQVSSRKNFLKAESDYRTNQAQIVGLKSQLELLQVDIDQLESSGISSHLKLYAPITGSITRVMVNRGMYTPPNEPLLELVNTDHLHLELGVYERDASQIIPGQKIQFYLPENHEELFEGEVFKVGNQVQEENRTVLVHGHIPENLASRFPVGAYIQAEITLDRKQVFALPEEALLREGEHTYALIVNRLQDGGYLLKKTAVKTGTEQSGFVPVLTDSSDLLDKEFLTRGAFWFKTEAE